MSNVVITVQLFNEWSGNSLDNINQLLQKFNMECVSYNPLLNALPTSSTSFDTLPALDEFEGSYFHTCPVYGGIIVVVENIARGTRSVVAWNKKMHGPSDLLAFIDVFSDDNNAFHSVVVHEDNNLLDSLLKEKLTFKRGR